MHSTFAGFSELGPQLPPAKVEYLQNAMAARVSVLLKKQAAIGIWTA